MNDQEFKEWESDVFGYGYGSGEMHVLSILKKAFSIFPEKGNYDYSILEKELTPEVFWIFMNTLCHTNKIIEYGSSPRYGWLDKKGVEIKKYLENKDLDYLYELIMRDDNQ